MESASNLQSLDEETKSNKEDDMPAFEVDSIELATPDLFSENQAHTEEKDDQKIQIFENKEEQKEPEMFEKSESEEDFEIPAFLRRQKN